MGTKVTLGTAYHPQTDGQTERTIQTLKDMLMACALDFKGNWIEHLPLIEFAYNNNYHSSIEMTPNQANTQPELVQITVEKVAIIREKLKAAKDRQKSWVDLRRRPLEFEVREKTYVKVSSMKGVVRFSNLGKLNPRYVRTLRNSGKNRNPSLLASLTARHVKNP
ncbi:uncharacterized protein LOC142525945 [Primulina tabacum]|uniref:uncharacterized protein LOC142525945 n=1 Tax=Primulina tabacum TaxID=48773 RepID=UPI003F5930C9